MGIPECNTLPAQQSAAEFPAGKGGPPSAFDGGRVARHIYLVDKIYPHARRASARTTTTLTHKFIPELFAVCLNQPSGRMRKMDRQDQGIGFGDLAQELPA